MALLSNWRTLAVLALMAIALIGTQTLRLAHEQRDHANTKAAWAEEHSTNERAYRQEIEKVRAEEQRRSLALQEVITHAEQEKASARADAAANAAAGDKLRQQIAKLNAAITRSRDSATADTRQAATATADLLADVQRRLGEAEDATAGHADESRFAGLACERSYDALNVSKEIRLADDKSSRTWLRRRLGQEAPQDTQTRQRALPVR